MKKSRSKLKRSTIITMVSCGSFIVMTFLALLFFVKFPITPSEKIMASIGREGIYKNNNTENTITTTQTTVSETSQITTQTTETSTHTDFVITITSGKGFKTEGYTPSITNNSEEILDNSETPEETEYIEDYNY